MLWEEDKKAPEYVVPEDVVDICYKLDCKMIPTTHATELREALYEALPWLQDELYVSSQVSPEFIRIELTERDPIAAFGGRTRGRGRGRGRRLSLRIEAQGAAAGGDAHREGGEQGPGGRGEEGGERDGLARRVGVHGGRVRDPL